MWLTHDSDTVSVIDGQTNTVIGSPIPVGDHPSGIAFNSDNGDMYVTNHNSDTVSVIDGQTNTVIGSPIPVGDGPGGIAFNSDNGDMYVTNYLDDTVSVIQTSTPSESIQNLIDTINDLDISKRAKTSLTASLKIAIKLLTDDNPDNDKAPCRILDAFLATVHSFEAIKQLTSLQAEQLSQQAIAIKNSLGCDEVTCTCPPKGSEQSLTDESRSKGITILDIFS